MTTTFFFPEDAYSSLKSFLQHSGSLIHKGMMDAIPQREPSEYLYDLMKNYPMRGGKKFRSSLLLMSCELFGGTRENALTSAVALETFQNFVLIHDDIEDESLTRRGEPTLHRLCGIPLAINAGDSLMGLVYEILLNNQHQLGAAKAFEVMEYLSKVFRYTFEGQAIDIGWISHQVFPSREAYQQMIERKTGWYSGKGPCQCGAMIADAPSASIKLIGKFGEAIGLGFQARDDLLNLMTDSRDGEVEQGQAGYGKERGGDIAEGKRTLITIELEKRLPSYEATQLQGILLKPRQEVTENEIEWCIQKAHETGAIDAVIQFCQEQSNIAEHCLEQLPEHPIKAILAELTQYLAVERSH